MANKPEHKGNNANNVVDLVLTKCLAEGCKKKQSKASFCDEHYDWFKAGLITKSGSLAKDFEKKYQHFHNKHKKSA